VVHNWKYFEKGYNIVRLAFPQQNCFSKGVCSFKELGHTLSKKIPIT
jgi:hypothetical protein